MTAIVAPGIEGDKRNPESRDSSHRRTAKDQRRTAMREQAEGPSTPGRAWSVLGWQFHGLLTHGRAPLPSESNRGGRPPPRWRVAANRSSPGMTRPTFSTSLLTPPTPRVHIGDGLNPVLMTLEGLAWYSPAVARPRSR